MLSGEPTTFLPSPELMLWVAYALMTSRMSFPMINLRAFSSLSKVSVSIYMHVTWVFVPGIENRFAVHICLCSYLMNVSLDC